MSELELSTYNQSVDFADRVYCSSEVRIGSHIRKTVCMTFQEMQEYNANQMSRVNALAVGAISDR